MAYKLQLIELNRYENYDIYFQQSSGTTCDW